MTQLTRLPSLSTAEDAQLQAELDSAFRLFGVCAALGSGHLPNNAQLDNLLARLAAAAQDARSPGQSGDTLHALTCARQLAETARLAVREKNADELLQDTAWQLWARSGGDSTESSASFSEYSSDDDENDDGQTNLDSDLANAVTCSAGGREHEGEGGLSTAARHIKRLGTIFATQPEVRQALSDALSRLRDMVSAPSSPEPEFAPIAPSPAGFVPGSWGGSQSGSEFDEFEDAQTSMPLNEGDAALLSTVRRAVEAMQHQPGYSSAMDWLLGLFRDYEAEAFARVSGEARWDMTPKQLLLHNLVEIGERFRGSVGPMQQALQDMYRDAAGSLSLRLLWRDVEDFARAVLLQPGYVGSEDCVDTARELSARAQTWIEDRMYRVHWAEFLQSMQAALGLSDPPTPEAPASPQPDDVLTERLQGDAYALFSALALDARGCVVWKPRMWTELVAILVPKVKRSGSFLLPRAEFVSPNVELVLENIVLELEDVLPSALSIETYDAIRYPDDGTSKTRIRLRVKGLQANVHNALAYVRFKALGLWDTGRTDITLARDGVSAELDLDVDLRPGAQHAIKVRHCAVTIDELAIRVKGSNRGWDWLYKFLMPLAAVPWLKSTLSTSWTELLQEAVEKLDEQVVILRDRLAAVNADVDVDGNGQGVVARTAQVFLDRWEELKREPPPPPKPAKFLITTRLEDTLLPDSPYWPQSFVHRRWRAEQAAYTVGLGVSRTSTPAGSTIGLFAVPPKPWYADVFTTSANGR